jgi:hypothetical protein
MMFVLATSLAPFSGRPDATSLQNRLERSVNLAPACTEPVIDLVLHAALFVPVGVALASMVTAMGRRPRWIGSFFSAALFCLVVETGQLLVPFHHAAHLADLVAHIMGSAVGILIAARLNAGRQSRARFYARHERAVAAGVFCLTALAWFVAILLPPLQKVTIADWDLSYPLLVGNEQRGQRPWLGEIAFVAIYDQALSRNEITRCFATARGTRFADARPESAPVAVYDFRMATGPAVYPTGRVTLYPLTVDSADSCQWLGDPHGLAICRPAGFSTVDPPTEITRALLVAGRFSVEVLFVPADTRQHGPARIISLSNGPDRRNFTLGQEKDGLELRVRNRVAGLNGTDPALRVARVLTAGQPCHVVAAYADGLARLHIAGTPDPYELRYATPSRVIWLGDSIVSQIVGAVLVQFPLILSTGILVARRGVRVPWALGGIAALIVMEAGWFTRFALAGYHPDLVTTLVATLPAVTVLPVLALLCRSVGPCLNPESANDTRQVTPP